MGSFMSKHSAAARERKALLGNMPVDNKASALNYEDPDDKKKSKLKGPTPEEIEAIRQRVFNRNKRGDYGENVLTDTERKGIWGGPTDVRTGNVKKP